MKKNVALFDSSQEEAKDFIQGLQQATGLPWQALVLTANQGRKTKLHNLWRYVKYFAFPLSVFFKRKQYDKIVGWQAFYGLLFAFYCRLFHVKKVNTLLIKNFIYKPKKGLVGKVYWRFMRYIVKSPYVDVFVCSSQRFCEHCAKVFDEPLERFVFLPFGINDFTKVVDMRKPAPNDYILALGRSNRDWDFLIKALGDTEYPVRIVCDELHVEAPPKNITIYNNVWKNESYEFVRGCKMMIIPILDGDIVAGETVLLQAMSFSKPIIITKPSCLADDYVEDGKTGLVVPKEKDALVQAVERLYRDEEFYLDIAANSRKRYEQRHSLYSFGMGVGKVLSEC
ncbi:MAG: glycosyltransferase family 4 protein [Oscillospiraceae bacterium]|nr:glycosyltransferase family 4 protein [Oscillospiraceae bacterium]